MARCDVCDAGLNAGFLVGGEHELVAAQAFALPLLGIQIEDAPGLEREIRIAREDPGAVLPGPNGVLVQQRHTVVALMRATMPHCCASRTISAQLKRDSGNPRVAGSSQARALICTTSSGGKGPGAARARALFEPWESFTEEPLAPQANHVAPDRERSSDLVVGATLGGEQNHPGAQHLEIWRRILPRSVFQDLAFLAGEVDRERALSWHVGSLLPGTIADMPTLGNN